MDPITHTLLRYISYLETGGTLHNANGLLNTQRDRVRKLHPSKLGPGLCDRAAAYDVLLDTGKIHVADWPPEQWLDFRVGHVLQGFVTEALDWAGLVIDAEVPVGDIDFTGRIDLLLDGRKIMNDSKEPEWLVDVKAVKSYDLYGRHQHRYPKHYSIAQVEKYAELYNGKVRPFLYHVTRTSLQGRLFTWTWNQDDCQVYSVDEPDTDPRPHGPIIRDLRMQMENSEDVQVAWLQGGPLPERCGSTPDEHPFMCVQHNHKKGMCYPKCRYFKICWEAEPEPFRKGTFGTSEPDIW